MTKLIVLKFTGNLPQQGYEITLQISEEGQQPHIEETGKLPPKPDLAGKIAHHWQEKYRHLVAPYRRCGWPTNDLFQPLDVELDTKFAVRIQPKRISHTDPVKAGIQACQNSANELQTLFLQWLSSPEFRGIDQCLRTYLSPDEVLRFLIRSEDKNLQKMPWHAWDVFRVFQAEPSFSSPRLKATSKPIIAQEMRSIRILAILGHSEGIDVDEDRKLLKKLAPETRFLVQPKLKEITDQLWKGPWDIIFFAGHSETEGDTGKIYINPDEYLTVDYLWYGLRQAVKGGLQVAIFNSCDGLGLAQKLIDDFQIPHLIVMRELVPDLVAQEFLKYFLSAFAGGRPFHLAVREARERLQGMEDAFPCASWLPTVYENPLEAALYWEDLTTPAERRDISSGTSSFEGSRLHTKSVYSTFNWQTVRRVTTRSLLVASLVIGLRWLGAIEPVELIAFDYLMQMRPIESQLDPRILLVEITEEEVDRYDWGWPIEDQTIAVALEKLRTYEPIAIGLDMNRKQERGEGRLELLEEFNKNPSLVTICSTDNEKDYLLDAPEKLSANQRLEQVGFGDLPRDNETFGVTIRRQILTHDPNLLEKNTSCTTPYSFSFSLAHRFLKKEGVSIGITDKQEWKFGDKVITLLPPRFGGYQTLKEKRSQVILNYRTNPQAAQVATLSEVLNNEVKASLVKDKIVILGNNYDEFVPHKNTPYDEMPIMRIHAHMVSNLLDIALGIRGQIWAFPFLLDSLLIFLVAFFGSLLNSFLKQNRYLIFVIATELLLIYAICLYVLTLGGWLPLFPMFLTLLLTSAWIYFHKKN